MKKLMTATALLMVAFAAPTYAQDMAKCDDASMMAMQTHMDAMTDPAMKEHKEMAMKEMEMAKTSMKDGKMDDCTAHMVKANTEMMKK
jgi:hypothetical protein